MFKELTLKSRRGENSDLYLLSAMIFLSIGHSDPCLGLLDQSRQSPFFELLAVEKFQHPL